MPSTSDSSENSWLIILSILTSPLEMSCTASSHVSGASQENPNGLIHEDRIKDRDLHHICVAGESENKRRLRAVRSLQVRCELRQVSW